MARRRKVRLGSDRPVHARKVTVSLMDAFDSVGMAEHALRANDCEGAVFRYGQARRFQGTAIGHLQSGGNRAENHQQRFHQLADRIETVESNIHLKCLVR